MTVKAVLSPITDITTPLYHLARGNPPRKQLHDLTLAALRTATVAGLFFVIIPFNRIFGHKDNLSGNLAFASQWIIHPYAAAVFHAFVSGGILLVMKTVDIVTKQRLILTRDDVGCFARAISFLYLAQLLKTHPQWLDKMYQGWSQRLSQYYYVQN